MNTRYYPSLVHIMNQYRAIGGNQGGIIPATFVTAPEYPGEPFLWSMTTNMPQYHKIAFDDPDMKMQYHLAGYGLYGEEALTRLMGESVERYAGLMSGELLRDGVRYASYRELSASERCLPLKFLGIYDPEQQERLHRVGGRFATEPPTEDDCIAWVKCASLVHPGTDVWIPAQVAILGYAPRSESGEKMFAPAFSTGTAAHVTLEDALRNALIEAIQIDAFVVSWYCDIKAPLVEIDDGQVSELMELMGLGRGSQYEVFPLQLTLPDLPLPNFGAFLIRRDERIPYITFGVQADADPVRAMVRAVQESAAILGMGNTVAVYDPMQIHDALANSAYLDLDSNVLRYASPVGAADQVQLVKAWRGGSVKLSEIKTVAGTTPETLTALIGMVASVSEWAAYLDITPPELADSPWKAVRVVVPELVSMCFPGLPPRAHPRIIEHGGVKNDHPHALP